MVIVKPIKKGFTLSEMLVCMLILSLALLISLQNVNQLDLEHLEFMNDYLLKQSEAILNKESISLGNGLYFNAMGHINQAKTISFTNHQVIIHLGNGYATCE